jgi:hypothetical protein
LTIKPDADPLLLSGVEHNLLKLNTDTLVWEDLGPYLSDYSWLWDTAKGYSWLWSTVTKMPLQYFPECM